MDYEVVGGNRCVAASMFWGQRKEVFGRPSGSHSRHTSSIKAVSSNLVEAGTHIIRCVNVSMTYWRMKRALNYYASQPIRNAINGIEDYIPWNGTKKLYPRAVIIWRIPSNVKFCRKPLEDGSYLSDQSFRKITKERLPANHGESIEYTIEHPKNPTEQLTYRLITSYLILIKFPAELLKNPINDGSRKYHWWIENTSFGTVHWCSFPKPRSRPRNLWLVVGTLVSTECCCFKLPATVPIHWALHATSTRAIPKFQYLQPEEFPFFWLVNCSKFFIYVVTWTCSPLIQSRQKTCIQALWLKASTQRYWTTSTSSKFHITNQL